MVLLVGLSKVTSFCSLRHPISALMSASSLSGSPLWALTFTSRVAAPAWTLFCSLIIIFFRTSASGRFGEAEFRSAANPFVDGLEGRFAVRQVQEVNVVFVAIQTFYESHQFSVVDSSSRLRLLVPLC